MQLPSFNINLLIFAILIGMAFYGLMAGKQRLRILILSVYVGIVLAQQLTSQVAPQLPQLSSGQISWLLFGLPILIFGVVGIAHSRDHDKGAFISRHQSYAIPLLDPRAVAVGSFVYGIHERGEEARPLAAPDCIFSSDKVLFSGSNALAGP